MYRFVDAPLLDFGVLKIKPNLRAILETSFRAPLHIDSARFLRAAREGEQCAPGTKHTVGLGWLDNLTKEGRCHHAVPHRSVHSSRDVRSAVFHDTTRQAVTKSALVKDCMFGRVPVSVNRSIF